MLGLTPNSMTTASECGSVLAVEDFLCGISREGLCNIASRFNNNVPCSSDPTTCIPTFGTFNVVIPLLFQNGDKWIARIPRPGRMFTNPNPVLLEHIMSSLVVTTRLVRERTSIPVPKIHGWSSRDDNEARCPYMFMDLIDGISLGDCLQTLPPEKTSNIIFQWAIYTWELTRLTFPAIGCLGVHSESPLISVQKYVSAGSVDQGRDAISPYYRGPYSSVADYLFGISNLKKMAPPDDVSYDRFSFGTYLESLIPFALKPEWNKGPFYLAHDDFNVQNILVDPEAGRITAIIDWDYACIKPLQSVLSYPESLRWDLLAPFNPSFEPYQCDWSRIYRQQWGDALTLASRNIPTGCLVNVAQFLDDSPFFAELEKGLGEAWRESEAMKFCSAVVYGGSSPGVLQLAGQGMRSGPWMSTHGNRAGYCTPPDIEKEKPAICAAPPPKPQSILAKATAGIGFGKRIVGETPKMCEWKLFRERFLVRQRVQKLVERMRRDFSGHDDNVSLNKGMTEKIKPLRKGSRWWRVLGRRFYGVKQRTFGVD
jgi:hypothetical protein